MRAGGKGEAASASERRFGPVGRDMLHKRKPGFGFGCGFGFGFGFGFGLGFGFGFGFDATQR